MVKHGRTEERHAIRAPIFPMTLLQDANAESRRARRV